MGYCKRVRDKVYRIRYDVPTKDGISRKQKRETLVNVTKAEAEAILAQRKRAIKLGEYVQEDDLTLSEVFDRFMVSKKSRLEATTFARYESLFNKHLKPALGQIKLKHLRQGHLLSQYAEWQKGATDRRISARTIRHAHDVLRNSLNWAVRMEFVSRNVAALVRSDDLPKAIKPRPKALTEVELVRLLAEAQNPSSRAKKRGYLSSQPWFYPAIVFAAYTGARRGEILAVRWSDIDFIENTVTICRSITESVEFKRPKNDKSRILIMPHSLVVF